MVAQTLPAGDFDPTFGDGGGVLTSVNSGEDRAQAAILQEDGKIVVAGYTTSDVSGKDFVCLRYNTDGSLDTSFGTDGISSFDIQVGSDDIAHSVALQEGKIILGGYSDDGSKKSAALIRLNSDGTLDDTFGTDGKVLTSFLEATADEIKVVKIHLLTGNIIIGGTAAQTSTNSQGVVARYTEDGELDVTFNTTGLKRFSNSSLYGAGTHYTIVEDLAVKPNGKISFAGWGEQQGLQWSADFLVGRINADGEFDTSFDSDGYRVLNGGFNGNDKLFSLILKSDDGIIVGGSNYLTALNYSFVALEMAADGALSSANQTSANFGDIHNSLAYGMAIDSNDNLVLAGTTGAFNTPTITNIAVYRADSNYDADTTFGTDGIADATFDDTVLNEATEVLVQTDDKIVTVGYSGNDIALVRFLGEETLGGDNVELDNASFQVYPNPATDFVNINVTNSQFDNADYSMIDINGRVIMTGTLRAGLNQLNVDTIAKGMYFVKVKGFSDSFKVIVK